MARFAKSGGVEIRIKYVNQLMSTAKRPPACRTWMARTISRPRGGAAKARIGESVSERSEHQPARFVVIETVLAKYACPALSRCPPQTLNPVWCQTFANGVRRDGYLAPDHPVSSS
jgi:hypothetical protein